MPDPDLSGRTALVTGGGRGIGRATALALARAGAAVVVVARSDGQIQRVAGEIVAGGGRARAMAADVGREDDVRRLFADCGPVDILINNAGVIQPIAPIASIEPAAWRESIAINLDGVFLMCRFALDGMRARRWGRIINVSSGAASSAIYGWGAYSAAKAGVEIFTATLAREVAGEGIRVNAIRPGKIDTEMQVEIRASTPEQFSAENVELYRGFKERGELRRPEDPARLMLWLLSDEAEDINGQVLNLSDAEVQRRIGLLEGSAAGR